MSNKEMNGGVEEKIPIGKRLFSRKTASWAICYSAGIVTTAAIYLACTHMIKSENFLDMGQSTHPQRIQFKVTKESEADASTAVLHKNADSLPTTLTEVTSVRSSFLRSKLLIDVLTSVDVQTIRQLVEESQSISIEQGRQEIQETIVRGLTLIDPESAVAQVSELPEQTQSKLLRTIFQEWSLFDLEAAMSFAKQLDQSKKGDATRGILESLYELPDRELLRISEQLDSAQLGIGLLVEFWDTSRKEISGLDDIWTTMIKQNPDKGDQNSPWQLYLLRKIASAWVDQKGIEVLQEINETLDHELDRISVVSSVLVNLVASNPQQAFTLSLEYSDADLRIAERTVNAWAQSDPASALESVSLIDNWYKRKTLQNKVVSTWAFNEPLALLEQTSDLPIELRATAQTNSFRRLARTSPATAVSFFDSIIGRELRDRIAIDFATTWMEQDLDSALHWVKSDPNVSEIRHLLLSRILRKLAKSNPQLALTIATEEPAANEKPGLESDVIYELARLDVNMAINLLNVARDKSTRISSYRWVGNELMRNGDVDRALKLGDELSKQDRKQYLSLLFQQLAFLYPDELLARLDQLPEVESKARAAEELTRNYQFMESLSSDKLEVIESHLP